MDPDRHICLILTGGTICMQPSLEGYIPSQGQLLSKCLATSSTFNDISATKIPGIPIIIDELGASRPADFTFALPELSSTEPSITYTAFEFQNPMDSSSADANSWNTIASCVVANYQSFDGFVVLHGTDTLSYAASSLSFLLYPLTKPVIFTGSQRSIFDDPSDARGNILGALYCAARSEATRHEVGVYFHQTLYRGNRSTKIHTSDYAAFASPNMPEPLARLPDGQQNPIVSSPPNSSLTAVTHPSKAAPRPLVTLRTQDVALIRVYPGLSSTVLSAFINSMPKLRGLVIETFGAGHMPSTLDFRSVFQAAIEQRGIVVVNVSQCVKGTVTTHYAPAKALQKLGIVHGQDMTTEAAFTKLMWLLSQHNPLSRGEIQALMTRDLRGELTESTAGMSRSPVDVENKTSCKSMSGEPEHVSLLVGENHPLTTSCSSRLSSIAIG